MAETPFPVTQSDFNITELITQAFELCRVHDPESSTTVTSAQYTRAHKILRTMLPAWQSDGMQLWTRKTTSFSLTQGNTTYSIGNGGTINVYRPMRIYYAYRRDATNSIDVPLRIVSEKEYQQYANKAQEGTPIALYYDPRYETNSVQEGADAKGLIYVYQPADSYHASNTTIYIAYQRPFNDFTDATNDVIDFPVEWYEAVKFALALRLGFIYGMPMLERDRLTGLAKEAKELAMANDTETQTSLFLQPAYRY